MKDFALIIHPISEELLYRYEPGMKNRPPHLVKQVLEWMSPFKVSEVTGLHSPSGGKKEGYLVMCPLLMEQFVTLNPKVIYKAVVNAAQFAQGLGVKIIGLTAFTSLIGNRGLDIAKEIDTPLTSGNACTIAMIPETVIKAAALFEIPLNKSEILIIGATNDIGRISTEILGNLAKRIYLVARSKERLNQMLKSLKGHLKADLSPIDDPNKVLKKVKVIIVASNSAAAVFDVNKLAPGTIVLDASYPRMINPNLRDDIFVTDGLALKPPGNVKFSFDFGLPEGLAFPCMVETLALALEGKYESLSLGKNIENSKVKEVSKMVAKHGFQTLEFTSLERIIDNERILRTRINILKKSNNKYFIMNKKLENSVLLDN